MTSSPPATRGVVLDDIDRSILAALQQDGRTSNQLLAERAGIAASTCLQRLRSLQTRSVIRRFTVELEPTAFGYTLQALVSIRITPNARAQLTTFADQLATDPQVTQVFYLAGAADFIVHVRARSTQDLSDFVTDRLSTDPIVASTNTSLIFDHRSGSSPV